MATVMLSFRDDHLAQGDPPVIDSCRWSGLFFAATSATYSSAVVEPA
jgi:hypothetical protein